ncbi:MAG: preprotein translocase subunit SecA [Clostridia bacterium]|nr:preprotein translocase subunit SecA [Clostridia bacterium]
MGLFEKLFGTYSEKQIKKIRPIAEAIDALEEQYKSMTDEELKGETQRLKARLLAGETEEDILPEAFATVREADARVLGKRPFFVQLLGGILLHQGRIAEMKTGEGKTLVATLPAYLNALSGKGVHIVTVNDYLARRDSEEMGRVYAFLGLQTGLIVHGQKPEEKRAAYAADITYGTNNELGFDYLRDNMALYKENMVQRGHHFAIVDEVDSILIDEARTPLIISGSGEKSSELYTEAERLARKLKKLVIKETDSKEDMDDVSADYIVDEKAKTVVLTKNGIAKAEAFFKLDNLSDPENNEIVHHINQAIRAHGIMKRDVDYVIKDGRIIIVDAFTGRLMPGRRYNNGLHQAIEAKEGVDVQRESRTLATITFQNYFRMYKKLSGMTGTALTEDNEFKEIYALDVVEVPTNRPMIRVDHNDMVFQTARGKELAIIEQIKACHAKGQPVLVGTVSIDKSELLSSRLKGLGIPHTVLNAKYHEREAEIIAQAGKLGAVTISTNMAGRGTDIMLGGNADYMAKAAMRREGIEEALIAEANGFSVTEDEALLEARALYEKLYKQYKEEIAPEAEKVKAAGGLFILGTERHESRRIDNQLRGRAGRQGDPGESCFFLSLQDDLMRLFGSERITGIVSRLGLEETTPINASILSGSIETAQKHIEDQNFSIRKRVLEYDNVMNEQRTVIYGQRMQVLCGEDIHPTVVKMLEASIRQTVAEFLGGDDKDTWNMEGLLAHYNGTLTLSEEAIDAAKSQEDIAEALLADTARIFAEKEALFGEEGFREVERAILLRSVDRNWMEFLDEMDDLKGSVGLNGYAQRNPITEYRIQGGQMFDCMVENIQEQTARGILTVEPRPEPVRRIAVAKETAARAGGAAPERRRPAKAEKKPGRNDPCPCGSGKRYKECCGANPNLLK